MPWHAPTQAPSCHSPVCALCQGVSAEHAHAAAPEEAKLPQQTCSHAARAAPTRVRASVLLNREGA